jgi:hypothetical protein
MKRLLIIVAIAALSVSALAPAALAGPADGNGNKEIDEIDIADIPIFCDEDEIADLSLDVTGFIQFKQFNGQNNRNVELAVFHIDQEFSNDGGETWVWRDRGPDRPYIDDDGNVILTITGRSGLNNIGHVVYNTATDEIELVAGRAPFGGELFERESVDVACETLLD